MKVILAPHLDDEIIGCYSIIHEVDIVVYYTSDYREREVLDYVENKKNFPKYVYAKDWDYNELTESDIIYLPSKYDYHPLHRVVRGIGLGLPAQKLFYSIEMNVPWLEEEIDSQGKLDLLKAMYPKEDLFLTNAKYYLFNSIKPYDDITWKVFDEIEGIRVSIQEERGWEEVTEDDIIDIISNCKKDREKYYAIQHAYPHRQLEIEFLKTDKVNNKIK